MDQHSTYKERDQRQRGGLVDFFARALDELLGGGAPPRRQPPSSAGEVERTMTKSSETLRDELEAMLQRVEEALARLEAQAQRLEATAAQLELAAQAFESGPLPAADWPATDVPPEAPAAAGPLFEPNAHPLAIVLAGVPGFQGLMDAQRALAARPDVSGASVVSYKNGEASLEVRLTAPVGAEQIVENLQRSTGHAIVVEDASTDFDQLRLRFQD